MQSFTDQQGVPLLTFTGANGRYTVNQSRYARLGTTADPVDGGHLLNGVKLWATNGTVAGLFVVMARVPTTATSRGSPRC